MKRGCMIQGCTAAPAPLSFGPVLCAAHGAIWIESYERKRAVGNTADFLRRIEAEERNGVGPMPGKR